MLAIELKNHSKKSEIMERQIPLLNLVRQYRKHPFFTYSILLADYSTVLTESRLVQTAVGTGSRSAT